MLRASGRRSPSRRPFRGRSCWVDVLVGAGRRGPPGRRSRLFERRVRLDLGPRVAGSCWWTLPALPNFWARSFLAVQRRGAGAASGSAAPRFAVARLGLACVAPSSCHGDSLPIPRRTALGANAHSRPASTSSRIHGITSSSIVSSEVVASKPSTSLRLADVGDAELDVVLERRVGDVAERAAVAVDLRPDALGELEHRRRRRGREVEVVVDRRRRLHREPDAAGEVAAVRVVADLRPVAEDVERVLALEHLEDEVRHDVRQGELHVAGHDVGVAQRPALADPDAVERPDDRVRQPVLLPARPSRSTPRRASGSRTSRSAAARSAGRLRASGRRSPTRTPSTTTDHDDPLRGARRGGRRSRRRTSTARIRSFSASRS